MSSYVQHLIAGTAAAIFFSVTAASAGCGACAPYPSPRATVYVAPTPIVECSPCGAPVYYPPAICSPCVVGYGGDYIVNQGPVYSGPGVIAPPPTYTPTRLSRGYSYISGRYESEPYYPRYGGYAPAVVSHYAVRHRVHVRGGVSRVKVIRARADVRIHGPDRMDIRLYR